jgi:hypothetical protein
VGDDMDVAEMVVLKKEQGNEEEEEPTTRVGYVVV